MKPNIILIMVDQMRGDCLGINGHPDIETPNLDMMAKQGYNFKNAYAAVPSCIAARASVLTGMAPKNHGRVGYKDGIPWKYENTIASEFAKAGYHTQCVGKMHVYPERYLCGFHNVVLHNGYFLFSRGRNKESGTQFEQSDDYLKWFKEKEGASVDLTDIGLDRNSWVARPWGYKEQSHPTNWVVSESIDFLRRRDNTKPFFLKMSFVRPHSPLDPPQFYYDEYINKDLKEPVLGEWCEDLQVGQGLDINAKKGKLDKTALKKARAAYYGSITHIDHQIRRFLIALDEYKELKNSIILFTSDHGDMLGDHNLLRKALPYEGSAKIPFIIYDPGNHLKGEKGKVFKETTELMDIMPTLLDCAGIDIPNTVDGLSLKNLIEDEKNVNWREYIHGEHAYGEDSNHYITNGREKYIWFSQTGKEQFFNLEEDPFELKNLIREEVYKGRINYFRSLLIKDLEGREEGYTNGKELIIKRKPLDVLSHIL